MPCSLVCEYQHIRRTCCLQLQPADSSSRTSETLVHIKQKHGMRSNRLKYFPTLSSSSSPSSSSSFALQPAVGFGLSNNTSPFFPIYHQLSPSYHSQNLKISFCFFSPSFAGTSSSSRPFQFLSEELWVNQN